MLALVMNNEEHSSDFWLAQSWVFAKWNFSLYGMENKEASVTNVYSRCQRKRSVLSIKDKSEDADNIVFQMICKSIVSRLNVIFLI